MIEGYFKKLSFKTRLVLSYLAYGLFFAFSVFFISLEFNESNVKSISISKSKEHFKQKELLFDYYVRDVASKVNSISTSSVFNKYLVDNQDIDGIKDFFYTIASNSNNIMQLRYIDKDGLEKIRVDRRNSFSKPIFIDKNNLQNKSNRYYFKDVMNFNSDDLWYSKIDLNKENGKIQRPIVPTLRVAKVIKHNNQKVGMLIVNIFMKNFLESLPKSTLYDIYLVDKDGYFILHPNNVYSWSKYLGQDYMLNNKFPKYYENILVSDEYHQYDIYSKVLNINNNENIRMIFVPKLDSMEAEFGQYSFIIVAVLIIVLLISIPLAYLLSHKPSQLKNEVDNLNDEIIDTQKEILATMGGIAESRCKETGNHINRVAEYSALLAHHYGLDETEVDMIRMATPMHDIGKVAIPDSVLHKPGKFDEVERIIMNNHSQLGYDMLKHSDRYIMQTAALIAYQHHERWDGEGYPQGLMEENIHIYGRIAAVADVFDALGSHRVYKSAWDDDKIFKLFKEERGKQFDPKLIDIFFDNIDEFLEIRETFKD